jgi:hypothetical protein
MGDRLSTGCGEIKEKAATTFRLEVVLKKNELRNPKEEVNPNRV